MFSEGSTGVARSENPVENIQKPAQDFTKIGIWQSIFFNQENNADPKP